MARDSEPWYQSILSPVLAIVGLALLIGGGLFGFFAQRSVASTSDVSPDPGAGTTIFVSYLVAVVGLVMIACALWPTRRN